MKILPSLIIAATALAGTGAFAQTSQRLNAGKANDYGLVYTLPVTAVDVWLTCEMEEKTPGEFQNYCNRYLSRNDAIRRSSRTATLKSAQITTEGLPDENQRWLAQFKAGSTPYMLLTPDGVPLSLNTEQTFELPSFTAPEPEAAQPTPLETPEAEQAQTMDMALSSSTSKRAQLASERIFELREMRSDILSGQAENMPADGNAMQLVLDNIAAQEAALTAMFTGTTKRWTEVRRIRVVPDSTDIQGRVIARLSVFEGIVDADDLAGSPVTLDLSVATRGELPQNDKGETKTFPKGGVAYRIPGTADVTVNYNGESVASATVTLAQLGDVFGLAPALFTDKKEASKAIFDPRTGALVELGPAQ